MALATWWRGDPLPALDPLPDFHVAAPRDAALIAQVGGLTAAQARRRLDQGHQPYLAYIGAEPAGYGWLAQQAAEIGELDLRFALPPADRYLYLERPIATS